MSGQSPAERQIASFKRQLNLMHVENDITHRAVFGDPLPYLKSYLETKATGEEMLAPGYIAIAYPDENTPVAVPFIDLPKNGAAALRPRHGNTYNEVENFSRDF